MSKWLALLCLIPALLIAGCASDPRKAIEDGLLKAESLYESGAFTDAGAEWRKVLRVAQRPTVQDPEAQATALAGMGRVELVIGSALIAERFFEQAIATMDASGQGPSIAYGQAQGGLAEAYERQGRTRDAIALARNAVGTQMARLQDGDGDALAHAQHLLARLLRHSSDFMNNPVVQQEAALLYSQVLAYQRQVLGDDSPDILPYVHELRGFLVDLKDSPEVQEIRAEAETILQRAAARSRSRGP